MDRDLRRVALFFRLAFFSMAALVAHVGWGEPASPTLSPNPSSPAGARKLAPAYVVAAASDEPKDDFAAELPRIPPVEPADALTTFQVLPGFRIEQVAAEPLVADPGGDGLRRRRPAVRRRDARLLGGQDGPAGRVRLLEDTDGDGRFDKSTVFVDELSWPTAVTCYDGGVFVGAAPDILYCKDTDGDGRADVAARSSPASAARTCRACSTAHLGARQSHPRRGQQHRRRIVRADDAHVDGG